MITIKLCNATDCENISKLSNTIWHECYEEMLSYDQRIYMLGKFLNPSSIQKQMDNDILFYIILLEKEIAGYFAYKIHDDHIYLHKLYSIASFQKKGIMSFVMNHLEEYKKDIKLNTCKTNKTLQIYLYKGFEITSEEKHDIGSGYFMDDYNLTKKYIK